MWTPQYSESAYTWPTKRCSYRLGIVGRTPWLIRSCCQQYKWRNYCIPTTLWKRCKDTDRVEMLGLFNVAGTLKIVTLKFGWLASDYTGVKFFRPTLTLRRWRLFFISNLSLVMQIQDKKGVSLTNCPTTSNCWNSQSKLCQ